jgi:type III secretory pathway component EscV
MGITSTEKKSEDEGFVEMPAEGLDAQLDDILDEVVDLAETMVGQEPVLDKMVAEGEEAVDETDFAMQTGDYLELEIDLPMEATEPQAKTTPLTEETESAFDALIDSENEVMSALAKEVGANDSGDSSLTVAGKDAEDTDTEKSLAAESNTSEESVCDAPAENTVSNETYDKLPAYNEQSSEDFLGVQESGSKIEDVSAPVGEASTPQSSSDQLSDMLSKKIESTISRLVEERLSIIVERSIAEKLERILANIR